MPDEERKSKVSEDLLSAFTQMYTTLIKPQFDELRREQNALREEFRDFKREVLGHFDAIYRQLEGLRVDKGPL